jgi:hypothetical protein
MEGGDEWIDPSTDANIKATWPLFNFKASATHFNHCDGGALQFQGLCGQAALELRFQSLRAIVTYFKNLCYKAARPRLLF